MIPLLIVAVAIKLTSPGPAFVLQERVGKGGKPFRLIKLRTMVSDADDVEKYLDARQLQEWSNEHTLRSDPRVTRLGRVLRAISFDEIPQFINVLIGQMSLVGPRPVTEAELHWYGDSLPQILSVRPGVTGLWQATERNDATFVSGRRQDLELSYIRDRSARLDLKIIAKTFGAIAHRTGV